jgi:hypothetical protein
MFGAFGVWPRNEADGFQHTMVWLMFDEIGRSVDGFLNRALIGVRRIVETLGPHISDSVNADQAIGEWPLSGSSPPNECRIINPNFGVAPRKTSETWISEGPLS